MPEVDHPADFEAFREQLHAALPHLHDPDYTFAPELFAAVDCDPSGVACEVQSEIIRLIEAQRTSGAAATHSRAQRDFDILYLRFVLGLTQEETAERLDVSVRSLQRAQREAVHVLARQLWGHLQATAVAQPEAVPTYGKTGEWLSQVHQELRSLQRSAPDAEAELDETIRGALRVASAAAASGDVVISAATNLPGLYVRLHPSVLRQLCRGIISQLRDIMSSGEITITSYADDDRAGIVVSAGPFPARHPLDLSLAEELLAVYRGTIASTEVDGKLTIKISLPRAPSRPKVVRVLMVDDNTDLANLYRSYCVGTPYELTQVSDGRRVRATVTSLQPDLILLDVLLPDMDGWDLLLDLRADPAIGGIPIIVCSVITDEQLALDLGAALYLRKPVWRERLVSAFDETLSRAAS